MAGHPIVNPAAHWTGWNSDASNGEPGGISDRLPLQVGPLCRRGLRNLLRPERHAGSDDRQSGDVERTSAPRAVRLAAKVLPGREDVLEDDLPGVSLTDLMPLHNDEERRRAYYVSQPILDDAVEHAPDSVRDLKILDPAVGSGHFLVVAFKSLFALYLEEARH